MIRGERWLEIGARWRPIWNETHDRASKNRLCRFARDEYEVCKNGNTWFYCNRREEQECVVLDVGHVMFRRQRVEQMKDCKDPNHERTNIKGTVSDLRTKGWDITYRSIPVKFVEWTVHATRWQPSWTEREQTMMKGVHTVRYDMIRVRTGRLGRRTWPSSGFLINLNFFGVVCGEILNDQ